ncbi:PREDICTED: uncharacterized protein LOC108369925 [Rhagoletis zephyria]|uniref:uncharacterized protein LOC108369925 n=1 Tax=Rhagoletis zephyria TaxID=28612 RepID=UPI000811A25C|nr:PREDICTED: uncharacterized protein LOC108369925 [Rhagoletis zephyria]
MLLTPYQKVALQEVVQEFPSFEKLGLGQTSLVTHHIDTGDVVPIKNLAGPMTDCLRKSPGPFKLTPEVVEALGKLKVALCSAPVLAQPDFTKEFVIQSDASKTTTARAASANHQIKGGRNASVTTAGGSIQRHRRAQQQQQQHIDNNGCAKQHRSKAASQPPHCSGNTCINVASVAEAPATHQGVGINRGEHPGTKARNVNNSSAQHQQQQLATSTTEARNNTNNESTQHQRQQQQQCPYQGLLQQGRLVRKVKIKRKKTHLTTRGCDFKCNKIHRASKSTVQVKATATSTTAARNNTNNSAQRQQRKRAIPATTTTAVHLPWPAATWGESFGPIYTHLRFYMYAK